MITLILIGLVGGLITGVSPCILPMLPIIFFAGAGGPPAAATKDTSAPVTQKVRTPIAVGAGAPRSAGGATAGGAEADVVGSAVEPGRGRVIGSRPLKIIAGLIVSFTVFTLTGSVILSFLGLPQSFLRWAGISVLAAVGVGLMFPKLEELLEKPFYRLPKIQGKLHGNPFVFGLGLGTLYVPCAGPVLAAITVAGATGHVGLRTIALTLSFAVGAATPLLAFAAAGDRIRDRISAYRSRTKAFRLAGGASMIVLAVALAFGATDALQRALPDYTQGLQDKVENSSAAQGALAGLTNASNTQLSQCTPGATVLQSCGPAPAITGISKWLNTPGGAPVSIASLKGKVVLVDFWAYSCINCQRAIPHVVAWDKAYASSGLQVIGIHSPEFAFEKVAGNVAGAAKKMGITYPVALDNSLGTWTNYRNRYWPAEYLIDSTGTVRNIKFGEGDYNQTEALIRQLLQQTRPGVSLPAATNLPNAAPGAAADTTPETYFAYSRSTSLQGGEAPLQPGRTSTFALPATQQPNMYSLGGRWTVQPQYIQASQGAQLRIAYHATKVFMVLGGTGTVTVSTPGQTGHQVQVRGAPTLYPILANSGEQTGVVTVTSSAGVQFYTATFG